MASLVPFEALLVALKATSVPAKAPLVPESPHVSLVCGVMRCSFQ